MSEIISTENLLFTKFKLFILKRLINMISSFFFVSPFLLINIYNNDKSGKKNFSGRDINNVNFSVSKTKILVTLTWTIYRDLDKSVNMKNYVISINKSKIR